MAGGVPVFIAGLENLSFVEKLSERFELRPQTIVRCVGIALGALVAALVWVGIAQGEGQPKETLEIENHTSLQQLSTEFDEESSTVAQEETEPSATQAVVVYVSGAVVSPGLYTLSSTQRVGDAVQAAGGVLPEAATAVVNLAQNLSDGMQIHIPLVDEVSSNAPASASAQTGSSDASSTGDTGGATALININTADSASLQTLDGVGPATAQKIIDYRTANGSYQSKEDLKNVSGIGEKKYAAIEAQITL